MSPATQSVANCCKRCRREFMLQHLQRSATSPVAGLKTHGKLGYELSATLQQTSNKKNAELKSEVQDRNEQEI